MKSMKDSSKPINWLYYLRFRLPRDQATFLYSILESHDGLCFYSTCDGAKTDPFRDIEISVPEKLYSDFCPLFTLLQQTLTLEMLIEPQRQC